ncbi:site-specific integrase [Zoogloea sp. LCSB751]|uniref:site-specific integrase n=1 Tax=Zoogloea sp. LCSB751 TaxID=1965277 RepID=UPI0009A4DF9B|nr:site-specific integrase [Zoogloea sp. LCSB751]
MNRLDQYLEAAQRENTRLSYESALRHFEVEWGGFLPATTDSVARYLADYGSKLASSTLRQRLAALARWHADHGFVDPTKAPLIRQVLKGIRALHPSQEKQAKPLELDRLQHIVDWLNRGIALAQESDDRRALLRYTRDRALVLVGFWRGFRADELSSLRVEYIEVVPGEGLTCYLPRSKGDREFAGRRFQCPALSRLCPVTAYSTWIATAGLVEGEVFRKIGRWGNLAPTGLHPGSLIPLLREIFAAAGIEESGDYSSHSLRRGFAGWARASGWDVKDLMAYVGWKDIKSAMRYIDAVDSGLQARFEKGLILREVPAEDKTAPAESRLASETATVRVKLTLIRLSESARGMNRARQAIEQHCFEPLNMRRINADGSEYELAIPLVSRDALDETIYELIDTMYQLADDNHCGLETRFHEPATNTTWD